MYHAIPIHKIGCRIAAHLLLILSISVLRTLMQKISAKDTYSITPALAPSDAAKKRRLAKEVQKTKHAPTVVLKPAKDRKTLVLADPCSRSYFDCPCNFYSLQHRRLYKSHTNYKAASAAISPSNIRRVNLMLCLLKSK